MSVDILYEFAVGASKTVMKLSYEDGLAYCLDKLREEDGDIMYAMEAICEDDDKIRPCPVQRMTQAQEGGYGEALLWAFILDEKTAVKVAKAYYRKNLSRDTEVDNPLQVRCNTPNTRVWSMLFGSLVTEDPRWYRFEFQPTVEKPPMHLIDKNEVVWKIKKYSESEVSMRHVQRPSLSKRTAAALAKEWYEDASESAYGEHYRIQKQPGSGEWYKTLYAECPTMTLLEKAGLDAPSSKARKSFERNEITDVMFLVHLMEKQDLHPGKVQHHSSQLKLTEALEKQCGITQGPLYSSEERAEEDREKIEKALPKMPHIWTMIFDAAPTDPVDIEIDDQNANSNTKAKRPRGMVLHDCSIRFECSCEDRLPLRGQDEESEGDETGFQHDGKEWTITRIIDPFEHLTHHVNARASAVDQRGDLADEHELLKAKLAKAPPPYVVQEAERKRLEVKQEELERFRQRSFLLGTHTRQKVPSKKQNKEMLEEAEKAYQDHLEEWAEEKAKEMEEQPLLKGVQLKQAGRSRKDAKANRLGKRTLNRGPEGGVDDPVPEDPGPETDRVHASLEVKNLETAEGREKLGLERKRDKYGKKAPVHTMKAMYDFTEGSTWADEHVQHEHWQEPIRWTGVTKLMRDGLDARHRSTAIGLAHQPQLHDGQGSRERLQFEHRGMIDGDSLCMRDLEFKKGDLIQVTNAKGRWFEGYLKDDSEQRIGRFPSTYVTEYYDKLTRYISVTIFSVHETRTEYEQHASRVGKVVSKAGTKGSSVAEASFSNPSVIGLHTCAEEWGAVRDAELARSVAEEQLAGATTDEERIIAETAIAAAKERVQRETEKAEAGVETGMTATVRVGKHGNWSPADGEETTNPVQFVDHTAEFGNRVSGQFGSKTDPLRVDRRGETITVQQDVGVQTIHHAAEDTMTTQTFSTSIVWDDDSNHHLDEDFGLMLSECGHVMGFISHEHGGPASMTGLPRYSRILAVDGRKVEDAPGASVKEAIFDILDDINTRGALTSVSFTLASDSLPVGWEVREVDDAKGKVRYKYVDVLSGHSEDKWPTPDVLKKMRNIDEHKKTGLKYSVPKFVHVEVTREARRIGGDRERDTQREGETERDTERGRERGRDRDLVDVKVGEVEIEIKTFLQELENLRLLYVRLKEEQLTLNENKATKAKKGLQKFQPTHHELERDTYEEDKRVLEDTIFDHIAKKDSHAGRATGTISRLHEERLRDELAAKSMHELREEAITRGVPVEKTMDLHVDRKGVAELVTAKQKTKKLDDQLKLLRFKIDELETKLATPTWYRLERNHDKHGGYVFRKGKWERKEPNARGPRGNTMPLWSAADVGYWLTEEVVKQRNFCISPIESKAIAKALKAQGIDGQKLGKLDEPGLRDLLPSSLHGHATNIAKAVEAEANDPQRWEQHSRLARLNHIESQFENDPPAWVKLSIAVTVDEPNDEPPDKVKHHDVPTVDTHHYHTTKTLSKETKRSMFLRACCGKPQATDKRGRPTTRREHAHRVADAWNRTPKNIVMTVDAGQDPGFELDDDRFVKGKIENVAKAHGIRPGMYLHAFAPNGESPTELTELKGKKWKWTDVQKLVSTHKDNTPHEYHFRLDREADEAKGKYTRRGVFVKGYGYAPMANEPVDVINAVRRKLDASTMASKNRKAKYTEFLLEALRITTEMQDTNAGLLHGTQLTDSLKYNGDSKGTARAIFQQLDNPYGKSADFLLGERNFEPKTLAQILCYWLDRQVHNAAEPGAKSVDFQPGIIGLSRLEHWSQEVRVGGIVGTITPVEFERAIEDLTTAVGCKVGCEVKDWKQIVCIASVPIAAAKLLSGEGRKQLCAGLAMAHGLGQRHHRGSLHQKHQRKHPHEQVSVDEITPNAAVPARGGGIGSDVRYTIKGNKHFIQRGQGITFSSKSLADALNDAGGAEPALPVLADDDFIAHGPGTSLIRCETQADFTLKGSATGGSVAKMHEALGLHGLTPGRDVDNADEREILDRVLVHLNRSVTESRTLTGKLRMHTGSAAPTDEIVAIGKFKMLTDEETGTLIKVKDEAKPYRDAASHGKKPDFDTFIREMREPSRSSLRGLIYLIREMTRVAMNADDDCPLGQDVDPPQPFWIHQPRWVLAAKIFAPHMICRAAETESWHRSKDEEFISLLLNDTMGPDITRKSVEVEREKAKYCKYAPPPAEAAGLSTTTSAAPWASGLERSTSGRRPENDAPRTTPTPKRVIDA